MDGNVAIPRYSQSHRHRRHSDDEDEDVLLPMRKSKLRDDEDDHGVRMTTKQSDRRDYDVFIPHGSTRRETETPDHHDDYYLREGIEVLEPKE